MSKEVEIQSGTWMAIADRMIHVDEYESILASMQKLDGRNKQIGFIFTFKGRINNSEDKDEVTLCLSPIDTMHLTGHILDQLEMYQNAIERLQNESS